MESKKFLEKSNQQQTKWLFWTCFIALVATSFGFIIRTQILGDLQIHFNLSETQKGELLGVGLWPFAISIILFSLVIDRIGYGKAMMFAFTCHVVSAIVTIFATGYNMLYWGTFILAIGNGTVEAVVNPVVATLFYKEKSKWINILHAGWPGGMVLGGILILILIPTLAWQWKVGIILIPVFSYGVMMLKAKFPVHERVKAGISFKVMLQEAGILGALMVIPLIIWELGRVFEWSSTLIIFISILLLIVYSFYVRAWGKPLFIILLLIMVPLATTELGTDSWITELVTDVMSEIGLRAGWLLIYTSFLMMILRFSAGPFVKKLKPLGLLAISSVLAIIGLVFLSKSAGILIFVAATIYGVGKSFFWPTMLGIVAERFPKGGAFTLNMISGVGMLSVGIVGAAFLGNIQDKQIDRDLAEYNTEIHNQVIGEEQFSLLGSYYAIDQEKIKALNDENLVALENILARAKKNALMTVAIFPAIILVCFLILMFYFKTEGGYKAIELDMHKE